MPNQLQYGLLPCILQGGVNHETAAKRPYLVRIDSVSHTTDIHSPDPGSFMRGPTKGWRQGGRCSSGLRIQR